MRDTTERPEALEAGTVKLVGTDCDKIVNEVSALLDDRVYYNPVSYTHLLMKRMYSSMRVAEF